METYTTVSGDEWDSICFKYYGTEMVLDEVMNANPQYIHYAVFPAGVIINMPTLDTVTNTDDSPPWMR